jgi:hypothetical protein
MSNSEFNKIMLTVERSKWITAVIVKRLRLSIEQTRLVCQNSSNPLYYYYLLYSKGQIDITKSDFKQYIMGAIEQRINYLKSNNLKAGWNECDQIRKMIQKELIPIDWGYRMVREYNSVSPEIF